MCEIKAKHKAFFWLEAFTSHPTMTKEEFEREVNTKLLEIEMKLNEDMRFRFHIHND